MADPSNWRVVGYFDSLGKIVGGITAVVLAVSAVVALVLKFQPDPIPARQATLIVTRSLGGTSLLRYLLDSGQGESVGNYTLEQLHATGNYYHVKVTVEGLRGKSPEIVWTLQRHTKEVLSNDPLDEPEWIHQLSTKIRPSADTYVGLAKVWIQRPTFPGQFYAVLEIDYPQNESLATAETPAFVIAGRKPPSGGGGPGGGGFTTPTTTGTVPAGTVPATTSTIVPTVVTTTTAPRPSPRPPPPTVRPPAVVVPAASG